MRFVKKPIEVEAYQMTEEQAWDVDSYPAWLADASRKNQLVFNVMSANASKVHPEVPIARVVTINGPSQFRLNDWLVIDTKGYLYPCDPEIFAATHEPIDD